MPAAAVLSLNNGPTAAPTSAVRANCTVAIGLPALQSDVSPVQAMLRRLDAQQVPASCVLIAVDNITLPMTSIARHYGVELFEAGCVESRFLVCKTTSLLRQLYAFAPSADWFVRLSLDCFVIYPHLLAALARYASNWPVYAGCARRMHAGLARQVFGPGQRAPTIPAHIRSIPHAAGGPLYALSAPLARWFAHNWKLYYDPARGEAQSYSDDVGLGAFFSLVVNTPVTDMPGVFQLPPGGVSDHDGLLWERRFKNLTYCQCPLPPPVHHHIYRGMDMRVAPVAPLEWPSLVAVHAKFSTWHVLEALERRRATLAVVNEELLVYLKLNPEGSSAYSPSAISVCILNASRPERLGSWRGCDIVH